MIYRLSLLLLLLLILLPCNVVRAQDAKLDAYRQYLNNFMRVRGDASGGDVVYYWSGSVYSFIPGEKKRELFRFEGFNNSRTVPNKEGFELLTREAAFFEDPQTGKIIESWDNPFTGKKVDVVQIWNDPVNQDISFPDEYLPMIEKFLPSEQLGNVRSYNMEIFPFYASPLKGEAYKAYNQADTYQAGEFFNFFVNEADLQNEGLQSVPVTISWTRISPWMPFMQMGQQAGNLLFVCRGYKLMQGFDSLPAQIKEYVDKQHPEYRTPPEKWTEPNETSWTYMKKLIDKGLYPPKH